MQVPKQERREGSGGDERKRERKKLHHKPMHGLLTISSYITHTVGERVLFTDMLCPPWALKLGAVA